VDLLAYVDRLGGDLPQLRSLLDGPLRDFSGVHLLPFYTPYDGADAGFDPVDHRSVDPRLGSWGDVAALAERRELTADMVVNHVSAASPEFVDWLRHGRGSAHDGMFLTFDSVFPDGAMAHELTAFHRPRPGLPFTPYADASGGRHLVWTTFMPTQVDLDVSSPVARAYLAEVLAFLRAVGVTTVRLDAVGYAVKTAGEDSFLTQATLKFIDEITATARGLGLRTLAEVHSNYEDQLRVAARVDLVYDFALPPLLLHAFGVGSFERLGRWLKIRPANCVTVLDTHDGIGVIDAGPSRGAPGLLNEAEMAAVFDRAVDATGGLSALTSVVPEWAELPHQVNATFLSALGGDVAAYLMARALQLWLPGEPHVYYVGLLGGLDDRELFERTGQGREVNRHVFTPEEFSAALSGPVTPALLGLVRLRTLHPAFGGRFSWSSPSPSSLHLSWDDGDDRAALVVDLRDDVPWRIHLSHGAGRQTTVSTAAGLETLYRDGSQSLEAVADT
jgi:sucrose phosphorylase